MFSTYLKFLMDQNGGGIWKPYAVSSAKVAFDATTNNVTVAFKRVNSKPFIWTHGVYRTDSATIEAGTDTTFGGFTIKFDEVGGLGQSGNTPYLVEDWFGHRGPSTEPLELVIPIVITGTDTVTMQASNVTGAPVNARFEMIGLQQFSA